MASSGWLNSIDIDPEMVTISANVEASYEATFD
jgi:hypothetical protein